MLDEMSKAEIRRKKTSQLVLLIATTPGYLQEYERLYLREVMDELDRRIPVLAEE